MDGDSLECAVNETKYVLLNMYHSNMKAINLKVISTCLLLAYIHSSLLK